MSAPDVACPASTESNAGGGSVRGPWFDGVVVATGDGASGQGQAGQRRRRGLRPRSHSAFRAVQRVVDGIDELLCRLGSQQRFAADDEGRRATQADRLSLRGDGVELAVRFDGIHLLSELLLIESEVLGQTDERIIAELRFRAVLAAVEQGVVIVPVGILLAGSEGGSRRTFGFLAEDREVAHLDSQVPVVDVVHHRRQGVLGPGGAVGALVVGVHDKGDRGIDVTGCADLIGLTVFDEREVDFLLGCVRLRVLSLRIVP